MQSIRETLHAVYPNIPARPNDQRSPGRDQGSSIQNPSNFASPVDRVVRTWCHVPLEEIQSRNVRAVPNATSPEKVSTKSIRTRKITARHYAGKLSSRSYHLWFFGEQLELPFFDRKKFSSMLAKPATIHGIPRFRFKNNVVAHPTTTIHSTSPQKVRSR